MAANRFTRFQGQQYVSNYTPVPFEAIMQVGAQKQAIQDKGQEETANVDNAIQKLKALPQYKEFATKAVSDIHEGIGKYATMDFNDPSTRQAWNKERINIASRYSPTGDLGKINMDYELGTKWQQDLIKNSGGKDQWSTQETQDYSNQFLNNWKDDEKNFQGQGVYNKINQGTWIQERLAGISADTKSLGLSGPYGVGMDFVNAFQTGTMKSIDKQKVMNALITQAQGDQDLKESLIQKARFNGQDESLATQFIVDSGKKNKEGNPIYDFNYNNPFITQVSGAASGKAFEEINPDWKFEHNVTLENAAKYRLENPAVILSKELPPSLWANSINDSGKLTTKISETSAGVKAEWISMMKQTPQLWSKYGVNSNGSNIELIASAVEKTMGFNKWMDQNKDAFADRSNTINSLIGQEIRLGLVNKEADEYAQKTTGIDTKSLDAIVAKNSNAYVAKMSSSDLMLYDNARSLLVTNGVGDTRPPAKNSSNDTPENWAAYNTMQRIKKQYNVGNDLSSNYQLGQAAWDVSTQQNKYNKAKDDYLTDNAKTKEKESFGDSYLTIVQPIYAKDGVTVIGYKDPSNDKGMKAASDDITKQIQDQFTKGIGVNDIFTTIQSEGEGTFKSIADIKTEEAEKLGKDKDPNNITVGIPYYSNIPDGSGNRQMYVNVGTQIVPINMKTLRVNYGGGKVPLDQLNNTPEAKTTNWIGTTYSSGVKNYPTTDNSGNNIVVSMPGKMNQGSSGSFANNTDLQVTYYDKNGNPLESYNGINAFNIINTLNQQGKLK